MESYCEVQFNGEESPLLCKQDSIAHYSVRTAETASTTSSYDRLDELEAQAQAQPPQVQEHGQFESVFVFEDPTLCSAEESSDEFPTGPIAPHVLEEEEMLGLTRNLSILPSDISEVVALPVEEGDWDHHEISHTPIWAYLLLIGSVLAHASVGPVLELEDGTTPSMKVTWRMLGTFLVVLPFMIREIREEGFPMLGPSQWAMVALAAICYNGMVLSFCFAVEYTAVGTAVILGNALAIIVLMGKLIGGYPVCAMEMIGAVVAMAGATLCTQESRGSQDQGVSSMPLAWFGNIMAIVCSFCGVGYLLCAKWSRKQLPLGVFTGMIMFASTLIMWGFQVHVLGEVVTLDANREHGILGCFRFEMDRLPVESALVLFCNGFGTIGYVVVTQYVDTLVITSTALLQPVMSEFLAYGFGVGDLPGIQGWIGNVLVALGTLAVVTYSSGDKETDDIKKPAASKAVEC